MLTSLKLISQLAYKTDKISLIIGKVPQGFFSYSCNLFLNIWCLDPYRNFEWGSSVINIYLNAVPDPGLNVMRFFGSQTTPNLPELQNAQKTVGQLTQEKSGINHT